MKNEQQSGRENKALPVAGRDQDRRDSAGESGGHAGAGKKGGGGQPLLYWLVLYRGAWRRPSRKPMATE